MKVGQSESVSVGPRAGTDRGYVEFLYIIFSPLLARLAMGCRASAFEEFGSMSLQGCGGSLPRGLLAGAFLALTASGCNDPETGNFNASASEKVAAEKKLKPGSMSKNRGGAPGRRSRGPANGGAPTAIP
jgi:hypothetical protein